jgi:hypothetical protein
MIDPNAALEEFNAHLDQLAEEAGVELDPTERQRIFGLSVAEGFSPESTEAAFGELVDVDEFDEPEPESGTDRLIRHVDADVARLETQYGRPLTGREREIIAAGAVEQAERYDQVDSEGALDEHYAVTRETRPDTNTSEGRQEFFRQRMADKAERTEIDPDREYDLSDQDDRHAYFDARMQGVEFEDTEF